MSLGRSDLVLVDKTANKNIDYFMPSTVRISDSGRTLLSELARDAGKSMTDILDAALETYRRDRFFAEAASAYESLSASEAENHRDELAGLDGTVADGLEDSLN